MTMSQPDTMNHFQVYFGHWYEDQAHFSGKGLYSARALSASDHAVYTGQMAVHKRLKLCSGKPLNAM